MGARGQRHAPTALPPLVKNWYTLYRRLGGPHCRSGRVWKISLQTGFDSRTVHPIASRYTERAIPALLRRYRFYKIIACPVVTFDALSAAVVAEGLNTDEASSVKSLLYCHPTTWRHNPHFSYCRKQSCIDIRKCSNCS
jgi:hypothetical protein